MNPEQTRPGAPSTEIKEAFLDLVCALSPENLTCDGELPPAQVAARRRSLQAQWRELEAKLGYPVSEDDVWAWQRSATWRP